MPRRILCALAPLALAAGCGGNSPAPTTPTPPVVTPPGVVSVQLLGATEFSQRGQTSQLRAMATLSNGAVEDRSGTAAWQSDNSAVAAVSAAGLLTVGNEGDASVSATVEGVRGTLAVRVRYPARTPNPAPGQVLLLPANVFALVQQFNNERPELLLTQSCPRGLKYVNNPWQDYIIDRLRTIDTRWGYNAKPTKTAADNGGVAVVAAGDEIAYNYTANPDEGSTGVYLIDILADHCGANPALTYRHFTGEEPGRWTGAGRF